MGTAFDRDVVVSIDFINSPGHRFGNVKSTKSRMILKWNQVSTIVIAHKSSARFESER